MTWVAEACDRLGDERARAVGRSEIAGRGGGGLVAARGQQALGRISFALVTEVDAGARANEQLDGRGADASRAAGDQRDLADERELHRAGA